MSPITLGILASQGGETYWFSSITGTNNLSYNASVIGNNDIYATGDVFDSNGFSSVHFSRTSPSGDVIWQKQVPGTTANSQQSAVGVAFDSASNLYSTSGHTVSTVFRGHLNKYNSSGVIQWQRRHSSLGYFYGCATDSSNNVYMTSQSGNILQVNTSGTLGWQRAFASTEFDQNGANVAVASDDSVYVAGRNSSSTHLIKHNSAGTRQWERRLNTTNGYWYAVAVDSSGNIYCTGRREVSAVYRTFTAKYDASGTLLWQRDLSIASTGMIPFGLAVSPTGVAYVLSYGDNVTNYVSKYDASGTLLWQRSLSGGALFLRSIELDSFENIYLTGNYNRSGGGRTSIRMKLPSDGSLTGTYVHNSITFTYAASSLTAGTPAQTQTTTTTTFTTPTNTIAAATLTDSATTFAVTKTLI